MILELEELSLTFTDDKKISSPEARVIAEKWVKWKGLASIIW
jgi:hypothetical protein